MTGKFTGWHMTAILVAFFGTVIAVNMVMATFAIRTFGGTVVDNSYVASQKFNFWLDAARAQAKLGWKEEVALAGDRHVIVAIGTKSGPLPDISVSGVARHPLGRETDIPLIFAPAGNGSFRSVRALPRGRWLVQLNLTRGRDNARRIETLS